MATCELLFLAHFNIPACLVNVFSREMKITSRISETNGLRPPLIAICPDINQLARFRILRNTLDICFIRKHRVGFELPAITIEQPAVFLRADGKVGRVGYRIHIMARTFRQFRGVESRKRWAIRVPVVQMICPYVPVG